MIKKRYVTYAIIAILIIVIAYSVYKSSQPGKYDNFAKCLTEKNYVMYGTDWCIHCKAQKDMFGKSFKYINFVNCDLRRDICNKEGIDGYPIWKSGNGTKYEGTQDLSKLAYVSNCALEG
jgi:hypothetical protein